MGQGAVGAYGLAGLQQAIRLRVADEMAQRQHEQEMAMAERRMKLSEAEMGMRHAEWGQAREDRQMNLDRQRQQDEQHNKDRELTQAEKLNESMPGGTVVPKDSPLVGRLQMVGGLSKEDAHLPSTQMTGASTLPADGGVIRGQMRMASLPGNEEQFRKVATATQADKAQTQADHTADNARMMSMLERQTKADAEASRHNKAMEARPVGGGMVVVQGPNGPELANKLTGQAKPSTGQDGNPLGQAPTTAERNQKAQYSKATPILSAISDLSEKINVNKGLAATAIGAAEQQKAKLNLNDDVAEYEAMISGFTPLIARALGHTGVLTEQDVQSVKALFPRPGDQKSLRDRKVARIQQLMGAIEGGGGAAPKDADPLGLRK